MLTHRQRQALGYIHEQQRATGVCPSYREIAGALGIKGKSQVHHIVLSLEQRGYVRRIPSKQRAIEVLRLPADVIGGAMSDDELFRLALEFIRTAEAYHTEHEDDLDLRVDRDLWNALSREVFDRDIRQARQACDPRAENAIGIKG